MIYFFSVESDAYRILGVFPLNVKSHHHVLESVMKALAKRGHQVEVVTHFELENPPKNYRTIINLSGMLNQVVNNLTINRVSEIRDGDVVSQMVHAGNNICELMGNDEMQNLFRNPPNDPPYDLVITEVSTIICQ